MFTEIDPVGLAAKAEIDAAMLRALALHPVAGADRLEQLHGAVLEHARPDRGLNLGAGAAFEDDGVDTLQVQEVREHETRGSGADDSYLSGRATHGTGRSRGNTRRMLCSKMFAFSAALTALPSM